MTCPLKGQQRKRCNHRCMQKRPWSRQRRTKTNCIFHPLPSRYPKKKFIDDLELLAVVWELERVRFHIYGKQFKVVLDHQALEPPLKRNQTNKQYNALLTRWLARLNNFDIFQKTPPRKKSISRSLLAEIRRKSGNGRKWRSRTCNERHRGSSNGKRGV